MGDLGVLVERLQLSKQPLAGSRQRTVPRLRNPTAMIENSEYWNKRSGRSLLDDEGIWGAELMARDPVSLPFRNQGQVFSEAGPQTGEGRL